MSGGDCLSAEFSLLKGRLTALLQLDTTKEVHMKRFFLTLALAASIASASAQLGAPQTGISAAMIKLFGDTKAFTAKADARLIDKDQKEISSMPMTMALRD